MLDKVDPLLQAVELHERSHLFLAAIKDEVYFNLFLFSSPVLLKVQLRDDLIKVKFL